jgi:acyl carrier protein
MNDRREVIREFVSAQVNGLKLDDDVDIFASGYVSSLFAVQVVMWVESEFGVIVGGDDLDIRNFRTIADIDAFVDAKLVAPVR